jgi:outer membrane lipoprotein SlyB
MRYLLLIKALAALGSLAGHEIAKGKDWDRYPAIILGGLAGAVLGVAILTATEPEDELIRRTLKTKRK